MHGVAAQDHAEGSTEADGARDEEHEELHHQWCPPPSSWLIVVVVAGVRRGLGLRSALTELGRLDAEAELAGPGHDAFVGSGAGRRGGADPGRGVPGDLVDVGPVFPGELLGQTVVVDDELGLRVDGVLAVRERELEELGLRDGLGRAGLHAQVAVDAAEVVDLVDEAVALAGRHGVVGRVVGAAHVDAPGRAHTGAQLAADALLHAVLVAVEDVATVQSSRLGPLGTRVLDVRDGDGLTGVGALEHLAERDAEALEVPHYDSTPSGSVCRRRCAVRMAAISPP